MNKSWNKSPCLYFYTLIVLECDISAFKSSEVEFLFFLVFQHFLQYLSGHSDSFAVLKPDPLFQCSLIFQSEKIHVIAVCTVLTLTHGPDRDSFD